ncbi:MAG: winged helix-turn-helix domain-containing protein, partial [Gemmatimonadota bacterium]|nr:winged helix-turn-helix domain-containing protein [Gemmatimonadota bacterium]
MPSRPRRPAQRSLPPLLSLDDRSAEPLQRQLYRGLREAILAGRIAPGALVSSTRVLASELSVSRTTVVLAYEQLAAEGYLTSARGSGTRVAAELPARAPAVASRRAP